MFARGLKRKRSDSEETAPSRAAQRQLLLDMSLAKLQLCHVLAEPDLCRSVLIANTVRQVQEEMTLDGGWRPAAPPSAGLAPRDRLVSTDILCWAPREPEGEGPAPGGLPRDAGVCTAAAARAPGSPQGGPPESSGGFPRSLGHLLGTLDGGPTGAAEGLFPDADSAYDLDSVLAGVVGVAKPAPHHALDAPAPGASCRPDLGELDHIVEILVET
ncbi:cell division cycle-associated protein 4 [Dasypus novemcinctus]|uniref:cell division cycle-associated protein 4 n=1 Tax=Dasypus novemcinctus TaxID=9361 RepID=UPI00265EDDF4|nr:cell division cycle-associated protein 4 [Dasypus novemcinctus]